MVQAVNPMIGGSGKNETMSLPPPSNIVRREVTRTESMESASALLKQNYSGNTDKFYASFDNFDVEREGAIMQRTYSDESPLVFQSTLSSLSKEDTSSESAEDLGQSNKDSIFRPRKEDKMISLSTEDAAKLNNQTATNAQNLKQSFHHIHNQVTIRTEKSLDYPPYQHYPSEVIIDPSKESQTKHMFDSNIGRTYSPHNELDYGKKRKASDDLTINVDSIDYFKVLYYYRQAFVEFSFLLPSLKPHVLQIIQQQADVSCVSYKP
jgi:hypothetical protein